MNTNLRPRIVRCLAGGLALWVAFVSLSLCAQQTEFEKAAKRLRFRSGWVLCAELAPLNAEQPMTLVNADPNEPETPMKDDVGYAVVTVKLDPGRTLGLYDFVLVDAVAREFPCIALRIDDKEYDAGSWQLETTSPDSRYSLLFKVPLQAVVSPEYKLMFTLFGEDKGAPTLAFRRVDSVDKFSPPAAITDAGTLGADPVPKAEPTAVAAGETVPGPTPATSTEAPATVPAVAEVAATPPAVPHNPDAPVPPSKKPTNADLDAWNKMLAGAANEAKAAATPPATTPTAPVANVPDGTSMIRYYPRSPVEVRMLGGVFEGTNGDPNTGPYTVIHTIAATPVNGWNEVKVDLGTWRYLRYRAPANSNCNVNEIEFYRSGKKLGGTPFGTAGSYQEGGNTFDKAFDGNTSTFFDAPTPDGAYVGIDTGAAGAAVAPAAKPADATPAAKPAGGATPPATAKPAGGAPDKPAAGDAKAAGWDDWK